MTNSIQWISGLEPQQKMSRNLLFPRMNIPFYRFAFNYYFFNSAHKLILIKNKPNINYLREEHINC